MKKNIIIILLALALLGTIFGTTVVLPKNLYALSTIVQTVDVKNDIVVIKDCSGNTWNFNGVEDWEVNDLCSCLMNSKGTPSIYDDEIISTRYSGQVIGWVIK